MTRAVDLLSVAGIDPRQGVAESAALMVRRLAMRFDGLSQSPPEQAVERGWCSGAEDFADLLEVVTGFPRLAGVAFGIRWPWFDVDGRVVAPGLPVRLMEGHEEFGPDGVYTLNTGRVFREVAGRREVFFEKTTGESSDKYRSALLWFSESARYLFRDTVMEIDDLFSKTSYRIDRSGLEQLLVRGRRVDASVLDGLEFTEGPGPATIEVARLIEPCKGPWRDPVAFLQSRIDVTRARPKGNGIILEDVCGQTVVFQTTDRDTGWLLERKEGSFPCEALEIQIKDDHIVLRATLGGNVDISSPGLRGRLVFDLNADLTAFVQENQKM